MNIQFIRSQLAKFFFSVAFEYPLLLQKAFVTIYLYETLFSALTNMIAKYKSRLMQSEFHVS